MLFINDKEVGYIKDKFDDVIVKRHDLDDEEGVARFHYYVPIAYKQRVTDEFKNGDVEYRFVRALEDLSRMHYQFRMALENRQEYENYNIIASLGRAGNRVVDMIKFDL